jgi:hypothetical protein
MAIGGQGNNIAGFVAFQARVYPLIGVPILVGWLAFMRYLDPVWTWVTGPILFILLQYTIRPLVDTLLGSRRRPGPVSLPGCGVGQIVYWASMIVGLPVLYWQGGIDLLAIGALLLPVFVLGIAIIASRMAR